MIKDFGGLARIDAGVRRLLHDRHALVGGPAGTERVRRGIPDTPRRVQVDRCLEARWYAIVAATGVIFAAVYLLWSYQRMFFGKVEHPENAGLQDLNRREMAVLVPDRHLHRLDRRLSVHVPGQDRAGLETGDPADRIRPPWDPGPATGRAARAGPRAVMRRSARSRCSLRRSPRPPRPPNPA